MVPRSLEVTLAPTEDYGDFNWRSDFFNCDRFVPVLSALADLACSMVNVEQTTQGFMAVQDQKLTAQTGGGILPPLLHFTQSNATIDRTPSR